MLQVTDVKQRYRIRFREVHTYEMEVDAADAVMALAIAMNRYGHMPYATSVESDGVVVDRANRDHENWSEIGLTEAELDAARLASESVVDDE